MSEDNLEKLSDICRSMRSREVTSAAEDAVEEALFAILQELRSIRQWQAENQKNWQGI